MLTFYSLHLAIKNGNLILLQSSAYIYYNLIASPQAEGEKVKKMAAKKYVVTINQTSGTCESDLFKKMATKGDITATPIKDKVGELITVRGLAKCNIETDDKNFDVLYLDTNVGMLQTGSTVFIESIDDYIEDTKSFRITEIKTKNGKSFKAVPELVSVEE